MKRLTLILAAMLLLCAAGCGKKASAGVEETAVFVNPNAVKEGAYGALYFEADGYRFGIYDPMADLLMHVAPNTTFTGESCAVDGEDLYYFFNGFEVLANVIDGAERVTVMLYDGTTHEAKVIGLDRTSDTAVVKIEGSNLTALPLGDSDAIRVGESVFVVGEPVRRELAGSVTSGIISAKERTITIEGYTNTYIQTDAAINFGSSGGPLLNAQGYVIGMAGAKTVTAGYDSYGNPVNAEGIGYALPINRVWEIATQTRQSARQSASIQAARP